MPKPLTAGVFLFLCLAINTTKLTAQLAISSGTNWVSTNSTYIVLDNLGIQYNSSTASPQNIFRFTGNSNVNLAGTTAPTYYIIQLAKTGSARLVLQRNINVSQNINFEGGLFDLNNNNITLASAALLNNENENSRLIGANGGHISISTTLNAPTSANPGNMGAIITSSQNLGLVTINRGHTSQVNSSGAGNSILRYYDITPANNNSLNATFRFHYFDAELNSLNENSLVMWKSNNNINWTNAGFTSRNITSNYVEKTNIPDFSRWTLSSAFNALPVVGLKLSGTWRNNTALLNWTTIAEYDNDHFDVERKYPADIDFSKISEVRTKHIGGNSQSLTAYEYTDASANAAAGTILYRLRQVDRNGQQHFSNIIAVKPDSKKLFILSVYPTAVAGNSIFIQAGNLNIQKIQLSVYDMHGKSIVNKQLSYQSQLLQLPLMSSGIYKLVIRSGEWEYNASFIKQ